MCRGLLLALSTVELKRLFSMPLVRYQLPNMFPLNLPRHSTPNKLVLQAKSEALVLSPNDVQVPKAISFGDRKLSFLILTKVSLSRISQVLLSTSFLLQSLIWATTKPVLELALDHELSLLRSPILLPQLAAEWLRMTVELM